MVKTYVGSITCTFTFVYGNGVINMFSKLPTGCQSNTIQSNWVIKQFQDKQWPKCEEVPKGPKRHLPHQNHCSPADGSRHSWCLWPVGG